MTVAAPKYFQAFTIKFNGTVPRIVTKTWVSAAYDDAAPPQQLPVSLETTALWDTGATGSVISSDLVTPLGIQPVGVIQVNHAGGSSLSPTYIVNFVLPNQVKVVGALVTEFPNISGDFRVILGMDVISLGDFSLSNVSGQTSMSFRTPSCAAIDYVVEANRIKFAGVGRNDPCPCGALKPDGSRIKFKQCHGAKG